MGQVLDGSPAVTWDQLNLSTSQIQQSNLDTLIGLWASIKDYQEVDTKWGDEIEYVLLRLDQESRDVKVAPVGSRVIEELSKDKSEGAIDISREAYQYMVETSPSAPYSGDLSALLTVEEDMRYRRDTIQRQLDNSTLVFSLSRFGMFGAPNTNGSDQITTPEAIKEEASSLVTGGGRYKSLMKAIETRRGYVMDTKAGFYDNERAMSSLSISSANSIVSQTSDNSVSVDDPIYAVGGCAVQVNFGATDLPQAFYLHDQLCPIGPLMLALTAASPILKGHLVETDSRWNHNIVATDDRSPEESHIPPRWSTSPLYFEDWPEVQALNSPLPESGDHERQFREKLRQAGIPSSLAKYLAHALARDPMMHPKTMPGTMTDGDLNDPVTRLKTHLSAIWPHIRLKLAEPTNNMPWMVEFRSMETQPTDFEIATMAIFVRLLQQTILYFSLEFRVPMHMVQENMERAQVADAVEEQKFWFNVSNRLPITDHDVLELSLDEIFNGQNATNSMDRSRFPGLLSWVRRYLAAGAKAAGLSSDGAHKVDSYLNLVSRRASGSDPTPAKWMRDFVLNHRDYNHDSQVTQEMYYEMMCKIAERSQVWS